MLRRSSPRKNGQLPACVNELALITGDDEGMNADDELCLLTESVARLKGQRLPQGP